MFLTNSLLLPKQNVTTFREITDKITDLKVWTRSKTDKSIQQNQLYTLLFYRSVSTHQSFLNVPGTPRKPMLTLDDHTPLSSKV